jgi:hypothetical protein
VAREVRSLNTGRYGYTEAEFREDVKAAAARRGAAYGPQVLEEALRRLVGGRDGGLKADGEWRAARLSGRERGFWSPS